MPVVAMVVSLFQMFQCSRYLQVGSQYYDMVLYIPRTFDKSVVLPVTISTLLLRNQGVRYSGVFDSEWETWREGMYL